MGSPAKLPRGVAYERARLQAAAHEAQVKAHSKGQNDGHGAHRDNDAAKKVAVLLAIHVELEASRASVPGTLSSKR